VDALPEPQGLEQECVAAHEDDELPPELPPDDPLEAEPPP
jgi:hypothetical protein